MNKQEKETAVATLKKDFANSTGLFLVGYRGMPVSQLQRLREQVRKNKGHLRIAKVRLVQRAVEGMPGSEQLVPLLKEQIALVCAHQESPAIAKVIFEFSKEHEVLKLVAGYVDAQLLTVDLIKRMATLPSREVLLAHVCGTMMAPVSKLVGLLNAVPTKLVMVLKQIEQKKPS